MNNMTQIDDPILAALRNEREMLLERLEVAKADTARLAVIDKAIAVVSGTAQYNREARRKNELVPGSLATIILACMEHGATTIPYISKEVKKYIRWCRRLMWVLRYADCVIQAASSTRHAASGPSRAQRHDLAHHRHHRSLHHRRVLGGCVCARGWGGL